MKDNIIEFPVLMITDQDAENILYSYHNKEYIDIRETIKRIIKPYYDSATVTTAEIADRMKSKLNEIYNRLISEDKIDRIYVGEYVLEAIRIIAWATDHEFNRPAKWNHPTFLLSLLYDWAAIDNLTALTLLRERVQKLKSTDENIDLFLQKYCETLNTYSKLNEAENNPFFLELLLETKTNVKRLLNNEKFIAMISACYSYIIEALYNGKYYNEAYELIKSCDSERYIHIENGTEYLYWISCVTKDLDKVRHTRSMYEGKVSQLQNIDHLHQEIEDLFKIISEALMKDDSLPTKAKNYLNNLLSIDRSNMNTTITLLEEYIGLKRNHIDGINKQASELKLKIMMETYNGLKVTGLEGTMLENIKSKLADLIELEQELEEDSLNKELNAQRTYLLSQMEALKSNNTLIELLNNAENKVQKIFDGDVKIIDYIKMFTKRALESKKISFSKDNISDVYSELVTGEWLWHNFDEIKNNAENFKDIDLSYLLVSYLKAVETYLFLNLCLLSKGVKQYQYSFDERKYTKKVKYIIGEGEFLTKSTFGDYEHFFKQYKALSTEYDLQQLPLINPTMQNVNKVRDYIYTIRMKRNDIQHKKSMSSLHMEDISSIRTTAIEFIKFISLNFRKCNFK